MLNLIEMILTHGFILFFYGFLGVWDLYCTYFITQHNSDSGEIFTDLYKPVEEETEIDYQPVQVNVVETYKQSELNEEQENFFDAFLNNLQEDLVAEKEDVLSMEAWDEEPQTIEIADKFTDQSTAKISDYQQGEQKWIVKIIGEEQGYIHVSDGTGRAWINTGRVDSFSNGDVVSIIVDRKNEISVEMLNAEILQRHSQEFSIFEEMDEEVISA